MSQSIGLNLLAKLLQEGRLAEFYLLKREYFYEQEQEIYDRINAHVIAHGQLPTLPFIQRTKDLGDPDSTDAYGVWYDEYIKRATFNKFNELLPQVNRDLASQRTLEALNKVTQFVEDTHVIRADGQRDLTDLSSIGLEVVEEYQRLRAMRAMSGIPSGWPTLDRTSHGFQRGDLIVFAARPAVGKSTVVAKLALEAHRAGFIPMVISMEMKRVQLGARILAMEASTNIRLLRAGEMTNNAEELLTSAVERIQGRQPFYFIEGQFRQDVSQLASLVHSHRPDILFVDGAYLLKLVNTNSRMPLWERIGEIAQALKNIAATANIPVVVTFQINREGGKKDKSGKDTGVEHLQLSDAIGQLASLIVGIFSDEGGDDSDANRQRRLKILKGREGEAGQWHIRWDFASMNFEEVVDSYRPDMESTEPEMEDILG